MNTTLAIRQAARHSFGAIGTAVIMLAVAPNTAFAMRIASGNPVCQAIKSEGGNCRGDPYGTSGQSGAAARDPLLFFAPKDFPKRIRPTGLDTAETPGLGGRDQMWPGEREAKPTPVFCNIDKKINKRVCRERL